MWSALRRYVRLVLETNEDDKELLGEPDLTSDEDTSKEEVSVVSNIAGATTPLGTGPSYPADKKKKKSKKKKAVVGDNDWYKSKK